MNVLKIKLLLVSCVCLEALCVTYAVKYPAITNMATFIYIISAILISFLPLWLPSLTFKPNIKNHTKTDWAYRLTAIGLMAISMIYFTKLQLDGVGLNYHEADMLPIIKVMCERFLHGQLNHVYDPIPQIWHGTVPIYLPAMWAPFSLPLFLQIDIRWITPICLLAVYAFFVLLFRPKEHKVMGIPVIIAAFILFIWLFVEEDGAELIPYTEEGVIIFYNAILAIALFTENGIFIGLTASLCMLSRYAIIGWIPAILLYMFLRKRNENLIKFSVTGIICIVVILLIPFGWKTISHLTHIPNAYINFTARVWHDSPNVFYSSLGLAKFFGPFHIKLQHTLLIYCALLCPVLYILFCKTIQIKQGRKLNNIPICCLRFTLLIFFCLIDVPYMYLFLPPTFISFLIVIRSISIKDIAEKK